MSTPHPYIKVEGQLYKLAGNDVSKEEVKESINKAADKAAIENIATNLIAHAGDIQSLATGLVENVDDKSEAKSAIDTLKKHSDVTVSYTHLTLPTTPYV